MIKFEVPTKTSGYLPHVINVLCSIDDELLFNEDKNLSHPADLFLIAFDDVIECAYRLAYRLNCAVHETNITSSTPNNLDDVRFDIFNLFFYTANFMEACQSIIKSLFKDGGNDKNFIKAVREFNDNTKNYRDHTSKIINLIKHQHRRINPFTFQWNNNLIIGYFVAGLVEKDTIGPDPQVHKKYNNMHTGISLNRDIPFHVANIYYASACLASVINKYLKIEDDSKGKVFLGEKTIKCLKEIAKIDLFFLPDECHAEIPVISEKENQHFLIEFPSKKKPKNKNSHTAEISVISRVGIRNRGFAMPYFRKNK